MSSAVCINFEQQIEIRAKENRLRKCLIFIIILSMHQLMEADGVRVSGWGRTCACVTVGVQGDQERLRRLYLKYPRTSWVIRCMVA